MTYTNFLFKKIVKSPLTWIPLGLIISGVLVILFLNARTAQSMNLASQIEDNIARNGDYIRESKLKQASLGTDSAEYQLLEKGISQANETIASDKLFLEAVKNKDWTVVYQFQLNHLYQAKESLKYSGSDIMLEEATEREILLYETLTKNPLPFEDPIYTVTGYQYLLSLLAYYLPGLLPIVIAFVLTNLYTASFYQGLDKDSLLPQKGVGQVLKQIGAGLSFSLGLNAFVLGLAFVSSSLFFGTGRLDYPVLYFTLTDSSPYYDQVGKALWSSLLLQTLAIVFISLVIYNISQACRQKMISLFVSLVVLLGGIILPNTLVPLQKISHWWPLTYLRSYDIVRGVHQEFVQNTNITFETGLVVLLVGNLLLFFLALLIKQKSRQQAISLRLV